MVSVGGARGVVASCPVTVRGPKWTPVVEIGGGGELTRSRIEMAVEKRGMESVANDREHSRS